MQTRDNIAIDPAMLLARRACWRLLSLALGDPRSGTFAELADPATRVLATHAAELLRDEDTAVARPLAMGERPLADLEPAVIFDRLPPTAQELNEEYEATFGLLGGSKCPPYETEYVPSKFTFQRSNMLADVAGFYSAFGLQTSSTHPDRPDHIALECEFVAQLLALIQAAGASEERLDVSLAALRRFLSEHVVWWFPAFGKVLARQGSGGFYEAVALFMAALIAAERALCGIDPPSQAPQPSAIETPDESDGCLLTIQ